MAHDDRWNFDKSYTQIRNDTMTNYFEPKQIFLTLMRWWWVFVLATILAVVIGYGVTQAQTPVYKATATVMVGSFLQAPQVSRDDIVARDAFTQAYAEMALREPILSGVIKALGLKTSWNTLKGRVGVNIVQNTPLIEISAEASNPQDAEAIAGEVANQLILLSQNKGDEESKHLFMQQEVQQLQTKIETGRENLAVLEMQASAARSQEQMNESKIEMETQQRFITDWEDTYSRLQTLLGSSALQNSLRIIEEAHANPKPISPHMNLNILLSICVGLGLALGSVFLIDQFDDRIRTSGTLEQKLELHHLGTISKIKGPQYDGKLMTSKDASLGTAFFYRKILENIGFGEKGARPVKSLLVTSPRVREGKSVTVSNLGIMMARAGLKTIIVDVDWIKPVQHLHFSVANNTGLMDLLTTPGLTTKEQLQNTAVPNLQILTTGNLPDNPVETLEPIRLKQILSDLTKISNVVILDAPSTTITESAVLFSLVEGVILVIDSGRTTVTSVKQSMASLYLTGGKLLGGILNRSASY
jgi:capsular exopolysaccharide synthesis family protein